jgi:hypothetical protein
MFHASSRLSVTQSSVLVKNLSRVLVLSLLRRSDLLFVICWLF